jgi:hypothetical protein
MTENEIENMRLRLMAEVNERFDEIVRDLNDNGTEFARSLEQEIESMRESTKKEFKNIWSYMKSKLVSIEQGQKLFYDDIFPKILSKVEVAVKMARDAALCTVEARKSADDARVYLRASIIVIVVAFIGIVGTTVWNGISQGGKLKTQVDNQGKMITALNDKLRQDADNQTETVKILEKLHKTLERLK